MAEFDFAAADAATTNFVNMDRVKEAMKIALIGSERNPLRKNLVLWGPGGYGKSEFADTFISAAIGRRAFVLSLHKEFSSAEGFGGVDIPALQSGTLKYRVEDSWMNHEYVILEEAFDAPDSVLLALKDILTRRLFTIGTQFEIKTRLIVVNTNHDPAKFKADLSKAAFLERFPYIVRVDWDNLRILDRQASYARVIGDVASKNNPIEERVKKILAQIAAAELWSPRRVIHATQATQDYAWLETRSATSLVTIEHLRKVAEMFGFDTAESIAIMEKEELRASIVKFENGIQGILDTVTTRIEKMEVLPRKEMKSVETIFHELNDAETGILPFIDKVTGRCINARAAFGDESNEVVDRLVAKLEDIRNQANMIWFNVMS